MFGGVETAKKKPIACMDVSTRLAVDLNLQYAACFMIFATWSSVLLLEALEVGAVLCTWQVWRKLLLAGQSA
jgi:hypothetical protein